MTDMEVMELQPVEALEPVLRSEGTAEYSAPAPGPSPMQLQKGQNFSVAAMVLGIVSVVLAWPFGLICGVLGIVFSQISKSALGYLDGKGRAGLICGIIGVSLFMLLMVLFIGAYIFLFATTIQEIQSF